MTDEKEILLDHLQSQNNIFTSIDYLSNLSQSILENKPNEKWEKIARELSGINLYLSQAKLFYNRVYEEMELSGKINYLVKKYGQKEVLKSHFNYKNLEKENEQLKKQIQELLNN